jgi:enoyl-CoA hydratase/carnithine racemase
MSAALKPASDPGGLPTLAISGARATITLQRPQVMNRIQPEDIEALVGMFDQVNADPALRVLVITGTGRAFSAGFHLGDLAERKASGAAAPKLEFDALTDRLVAVKVPTICRLNGGVYGGSTDLALCCDFRVGVTTMEMFMPAGRLGVHYYEGGLRRYVSRLGLNTAKRMFLTAEKFAADELLRAGYLTDLATPEELDAKVDALAERIAEMAPMAIQGMKQALNEIAAGTLDVPALHRRMAACKASADLAEGLAAFREKRKPVFQGR